MPTSRDGCRWGHWAERYSQVMLPWLVMVRSVMRAERVVDLEVGVAVPGRDVNSVAGWAQQVDDLGEGLVGGAAGFRWWPAGCG